MDYHLCTRGLHAIVPLLPLHRTTTEAVARNSVPNRRSPGEVQRPALPHLLVFQNLRVHKDSNNNNNNNNNDKHSDTVFVSRCGKLANGARDARGALGETLLGGRDQHQQHQQQATATATAGNKNNKNNNNNNKQQERTKFNKRTAAHKAELGVCTP